MLPEQTRELLQNKLQLKKNLRSGKILQDLMGFSQEVMDLYYVKASKLCESANYTQAVSAFLFLTVMNPEHYDYWLGLGVAKQHCHDYEGAIDAFELAAVSALENPEPYFHLAHCFFAIHDREASMQAINLALEYSEDISAYDDLHRKAMAARVLLLKAE